MEIKVRIDGKDQKVAAQLIKGTLWIHYNGRVFTQDVSLGRKSKKKGGAGASSDKVLSPMPGKITKVLVKVGDAISVGQPVLVMEAMKMEYTLKADAEGVVESVACAVGEQVVLGKLLVKINMDANK